MKISSIDEVDVAITVLKQSDTGMFRNSRLLLIKAGYLSYYSKMPKYYVGNVRSIELSGELPKMTLCASNVESIERKRKYIHIKFNTRHLIDTVQLKQIVDGQVPAAVEDKSEGQAIQWVFKCENVEQADIFMQQVLLCKNNPKFKPAIQSIINGYRSGKQGIRPESLVIPAVGKNSAKFRYSEQPEGVVKKFRTATIHESSFKEPGQLFTKEQENDKSKNEMIKQEPNEDEPIQELEKTQHLSSEQINEIAGQVTKQKRTLDEPQNKINTNIIARNNEDGHHSYGKQTFPYFPFVKSKTKTTKEELTQLKIKQIKSEGREQGLLQKLMTRKSTGSIMSTKRSAVTPDSGLITIKRSLTMDKKLVISQNSDKDVDNKNKQKIITWSDLKKVKSKESSNQEQKLKNQSYENNNGQNTIQQKIQQTINPYKSEITLINQIGKIVQMIGHAKQDQTSLSQKQKEKQYEHLKSIEQYKIEDMELKVDSQVMDSSGVAQQENISQTDTLDCIQSEQTSFINQVIPPIASELKLQIQAQQEQMALDQGENTVYYNISDVGGSKQLKAVSKMTDTYSQAKHSDKEVGQYLQHLSLGKQPENNATFEQLSKSNQNRLVQIQGSNVSPFDKSQQRNQTKEVKHNEVDSADSKKLKIKQPKLQQLNLNVAIEQKLQPSKLNKMPIKQQVRSLNNQVNVKLRTGHPSTLHVKNTQYDQELTPRFWEIQPYCPKRDSKLSQGELLKWKPNKQRTKIHQQNGKQIQQMDLAQIQLQASTYTKEILSTRTNNYVGDAVTRIMNHQVSHNVKNSIQVPYAIAMELLAIRKANAIKEQAIKLMIEQVERTQDRRTLSCENIMFGPRLKIGGWSLYIYQSLEKERAVWAFYQSLGKACANDSNTRYRCPKLLSLEYRSKLGIYIETPSNFFKFVPETAVEVFDKILNPRSVQEIKQQIRVSEGQQEQIIWISPDYISNMNLMYLKSIGQESWLGAADEITDEQKMNTNKALKLIAQLSFQQDEQSYLDSIHLAALKQVVNDKKLSIDLSQSDYVQVEHHCSMQQLPFCSQSSTIDYLYASASRHSPLDTHKARIFSLWKALKLLAISDLPDCCQLVTISQYLNVLATTVKLLMREGKAGEALEISQFLCRLIMGKAAFRYLVSGSRVYLSKVKVLISLVSSSQITEFVSESQQIQVLLLQCLTRTRRMPTNHHILANILNNLILVLECIRDEAKKRTPDLRMKDVMENHSYCCMLLHQTFAEYAQRNMEDEQSMHSKECAYQEAKQILHSSKKEISGEALEVVIDFIDRVIQNGAFKQALSLIASMLSHSNLKQTKVQIELGCRRDLCLMHMNEATANQQQISFYLDYFLAVVVQESAPNSIKQRYIGMFSIVLELYTRTMISNDESAYLAVADKLTPLGIVGSLRRQLLQPSLQQLEPEVRRRVLTKLSL